MTTPAKQFLQRWLITTLAVLVAANVVRGISYDSVGALLVASFLLGVFNAFLRPVMLFFSLPLLVLTLGLFTLVINAFLLYLVGWIVRSFHVQGFWAAFWGALIISLVSFVANAFLGRRPSLPPGNERNRRDRGPRPPKDTGSGPIIDV